MLLDESGECRHLKSSISFAGTVTGETWLAIINELPPPRPSLPCEPGQVPDDRMAKMLKDGA